MGPPRLSNGLFQPELTEILCRDRVKNTALIVAHISEAARSVRVLLDRDAAVRLGHVINMLQRMGDSYGVRRRQMLLHALAENARLARNALMPYRVGLNPNARSSAINILQYNLAMITGFDLRAASMTSTWLAVVGSCRVASRVCGSSNSRARVVCSARGYARAARVV
jgi:hypothetical protein